MEHLVEAIRTIAHRRNAEARLALLVVVDALRVVLDPVEVVSLADELPFELALLLRRTEEVEPLAEELALLDARTVHAVCAVLALAGPLALRAKLTSPGAPRLTLQLQLGERRPASGLASTEAAAAVPSAVPAAAQPTVRVGRRSTMPSTPLVCAS
jgi:hypothetical protein